MEEWHWNGTTNGFIEVVQWAFTFRQLSKDRPAGWMDISSNPQMMEQKADEYGMTFDALASEMLRIAQDYKNNKN